LDLRRDGEAYRGATIRREWSEKTCCPLEQQVPDIVKELLRAGPALVRMRREREDEAQRDREADLRRRHDEAIRQADRNLVRTLVEQAERFQIATLLKQFLDDLEAQTADVSAIVADRSIAEWLAWARSQWEVLCPLQRGAAAVFDVIAKQFLALAFLANRSGDRRSEAGARRP
jgi:hypothetical protein